MSAINLELSMILNVMPRRVLLLFRSMALNGCTISKFKLNGIILLVVASYTVVPAMNGHPRDQAKVSVHDRWPLIRGTGGQVKDATYNTPRLSPPAIFILNACIVIIMYAIVIKPKIDAT